AARILNLLSSISFAKNLFEKMIGLFAEQEKNNNQKNENSGNKRRPCWNSKKADDGADRNPCCIQNTTQFIPFNIEIPLTRVIAKPAKRKNRATGKGNTDFAIASIVAGSFKENDVKNKSKTPLQTK